MTDKIAVASRVHTNIRISAPPVEKKEEGALPSFSGESVLIYGASHPAAVGELGITEGVDPEFFRKWKDAHKGTDLGDSLWEISGEDLDRARNGEQEYGFEPALERAKNDSSNTEAAEEGSTVKHGGMVKASEMAATSGTPNDDSPRSQTKLP